MGDKAPVGIVGGTGLYEIPGIEIMEKVDLDTPFGKPSDIFTRGRIENVDVVFLSRHGRGHSTPATRINYRANIYGFKALGAQSLISIGAVGSMKEEYEPTNVVIPDQFFDNTKTRESTFFDGDPAVHVSFADPVCPALSEILYESGLEAGATVHRGGTYICIDGPAFSTRAESQVYRSWGMDVIGMTGVTEAKLAREAEMCYVPVAMVTDYDVWKDRSEDVTIEIIIENLLKTVGITREMLRTAVPRASMHSDCPCRHALANAIVTSPAGITAENRARLDVLLGKYLPPEG